MVKRQIAGLYLEEPVFYRYLEYRAKHPEFKSDSQAINNLLKESFEQGKMTDTAVERLNSVIQQQQLRIGNLEFELRQKSAVPIKNEMIK
jgi:hypothetical protein